MKDSHEEYTLLQEEDASEEDLGLFPPSIKQIHTLSLKSTLIILCATLCISSLALNVFMMYYISRLKTQLTTSGATEFGRS